MKNTQKMNKTATEKPKSLTYTLKRNNTNSEKYIFTYDFYTSEKENKKRRKNR